MQRAASTILVSMQFLRDGWLLVVDEGRVRVFRDGEESCAPRSRSATRPAGASPATIAR
jgi:hypothetical protein